MNEPRWETVTPMADAVGESPFWHPRERLLYWLDIPGCVLLRCDPRDVPAKVERWPMPSEPGCYAPAASGGFVVALRDGIYRANSWGGALRCIARFNHDPRTTRFNDGRCDPLGRFWAGTIYEPRDARKAELYSIDCRGAGKPFVELKVINATTANGLAFSPDATTVYWTDTPSHLVQAWDWDAQSNVMRNNRVFAQFPGKPQDGSLKGYGGRPDGAAVDAQGNYWAAMYEGARLLKLSPQGELLADIAVPALCPTMPCFGDDDLRTLYLTTARGKQTGHELRAWPQAGRVFSMRVDVPGLAVSYFKD